MKWEFISIHIIGDQFREKLNNCHVSSEFAFSVDVSSLTQDQNPTEAAIWSNDTIWLVFIIHDTFIIHKLGYNILLECIHNNLIFWKAIIHNFYLSMYDMFDTNYNWLIIYSMHCLMFGLSKSRNRLKISYQINTS